MAMPPQNIEAEMGVLGSMILDETTIGPIAAVVSPTDFYRDAHQVICGAIFDLHTRNGGAGIDAITLVEELGRRGKLQAVGGDDGIADLIKAVPHAANGIYYAGIVREKSIARMLIEADNANLKDAYSHEFTADELADRVARRFQLIVERRTQRDRRGAILTCLSDVESRPVDWLWPGRIPLGMPTLFAGDPGLGKSMATMALASVVSRGGSFPDDPATPTEPGSVILLTAEDALDMTIRPRLDAYGADPAKVHALSMVRQPDGKETHFNLKRDIAALEDAIAQVPDTRLIVIDPISSYLGGADEHRNAEVREVITPLARLVERHKVALVIVGHLNKSSAGKAIYRAMGSLAFIAAARIAWLFLKDGDDPLRRLMLSSKCNVGPEPTGLAYRITGGVLEWEPTPVEMTADEALALEGKKREADMSKIEQAEALLKDLLEDGQRVDSEELIAAGKAKGISRGTMFEAKKRLKVAAKKHGFGATGGWCWYFPDPEIIPIKVGGEDWPEPRPR